MFYRFMILHNGRTFFERELKKMKFKEAVDYADDFIKFDCDTVISRSISEKCRNYVVQGFWKDDNQLTTYLIIREHEDY